ncbi:hypothetical protein [Pseudomonas sp. NFACC04-2]|uniref:hypothetical protein n=1 Tax=Pseudomonas sp. NFACC04-2 TaxID=1566242 RepID=UPI000908F2EB|nr:hypothetical protein [Pseudomonas sp. NFACC04-2]SFW69480.1 hypothetical protein SAMN03159439_03738 [Pseudomonas sp. NFACC04-2]
MDIYDRLFGDSNEYYNDTGKPKYMDDNYFKNFHYSFIGEREQARKKKGKCIIPDCTDRCVSSHTIPESAVLKRVAHANEVLYPEYNAQLKVYECKPINIKKASAFPGFCVQHESIFSGFEVNGDFEDPSIALQNLRIVYRYLFGLSSLTKVFKRKLAAYKKEITDYKLQRFSEVKRLLKKGLTLINIEDEITLHLKSQIEKLENQYAYIHNEDLVPLVNTLSGEGSSISMIAVHLDCEVPMCLAGKSEFKSDDKKYTVHLSIFPRPGKTFCCFSLPKLHEEDFTKILIKHSTDIGFLNVIESWMVYGTDFWYINPTEWNSYSKEKQNKIMTLLKSTDHFPDEELDFTIFDNLRATILAKAEEDLTQKQ